MILIFLIFATNIIPCKQKSEIGRRIIAGQVTSVADYPFVASMLVNIGNNQFAHLCGGCVISRTFVISAAHCFLQKADKMHPREWRFRVGSSFAITGGQVYEPTRFHIHRYDDNTHENDLILIQSSIPIRFKKDGVKRIAISSKSHELKPGDPLLVVGWGQTSPTNSKTIQLRDVDMIVVGNDECNRAYHTLLLSKYPNETQSISNNHPVTSRMMCGGSLKGGGVCTGDSGGPVVHNGVVVGVVSWNAAACNTNVPSVFTRVSSYIPWIVRTVRNSQRDVRSRVNKRARSKETKDYDSSSSENSSDSSNSSESPSEEKNQMGET